MKLFLALLIASTTTLSVSGYTISSCRDETWAKHIDNFINGEGDWVLKYTLSRSTGDLVVECGKIKTFKSGSMQVVKTVLGFKKFTIYTLENDTPVDIAKVYDGETGTILKSVTFGIEDQPDHIPNYYDTVMFKPNIVYKKVMHNDGHVMGVYVCTDRKKPDENALDLRHIYVKERVKNDQINTEVLAMMDSKAPGTENAFEGKLNELDMSTDNKCKNYWDDIV